jgi:hypothetical protein
LLLVAAAVEAVGLVLRRSPPKFLIVQVVAVVEEGLDLMVV